MTGLGNLTVNLGSGGTFRLGASSTATTGALATMKLAANSIITANMLGVGDRAGRGGTHTLKLGGDANTIHVNTLNVGSNAGRGNGEFSFETGSGTLQLRAADGTAALTAMNLVNNSFGHSGTHTANVDLTGHSVDAKIDALNMAIRTGTNGGATSTFAFDTGTLEVGTATMARNGNAASTGTSSATINIGGGTASFGTINMARSEASGGTSNATLNLTGGTTTVTGDIVKIGGTGTTSAKVILDGGTLDMTAGNIGSLANSITLILGSGSLKNVAQINGGGDLVKTSTGTLVLAGINTYTGNSIIGQGILSVTTPNFADASTVTIGTLSSPGAATLNLPNPGNDTVASLIINGVVQASGRTYGNVTSVFPIIPTFAITGPGTISVPAGPGTPYTQWADSFLTADVSSPSGDNDHDGLTNQQEFAFGLDPLDGSSVNQILVQLDKTNGTFTYRRRAGTSLTYRIFTSTSLTTNSWTEDTAATLGQVATPAGSNEDVVVTLTGAPFTAPSLFVRVAAE
jgi:autotransporter-associated beta strand protein